MTQRFPKDASVYKSLFENSCCIMLILDPDSGAILDANNIALEFYQYSKKELLGLNISQLTTLSMNEVRQKMADAETKNRYNFQFRHRLKNGEIKHVEVFSSPIIYKNRKVLYSIVHDITEQVADRKTLMESENTIRAMINATTSLVFLFDTGGRIIMLNKPGAALFKKRRKEMIGENFKIFFEKNKFSKLRLMVNEVVEKQEPLSYQTERDKKFYDVNLHPVFNKKSIVDRICAFVNDITDLKMTEKVFTAIETAGGICHEMNQPLQVMLGNLELLKMNMASDNSNMKFVKIIQAQTEKLGLITKKLTHITHYETKAYVQGTIFDIDMSSDIK